MRIAYILLSDGLEYDDRIRKEMISMRKLMSNVEFKIFAFSGKDNHAGTGVLSYGVPYEFVSVAHREGKKKDLITMLRKEYSFYSQVSEKVKEYDLLWVCDHAPFFFPLFSKKPIIWDLHEIPDTIVGTKMKNILFHRMEKRCNWLIHANQERLNYLQSQNIVRKPQKSLIVRNYPDKQWISESSHLSKTFLSFKNWLGDEEYIYIQGITQQGRYPWETLSSIMELKAIKAVVIGNVQKEVKERVKKEYPDSDQFIYYAGQMIQSETSAFLAHSKFSIVFYNDIKPNNRYCEPNRMFQSLGLGIPVLVGHNEPMRNIVGKYNNGIVLKSDGRSIEDNVAGIKLLLNSFKTFKESALLYKDIFSWESQIGVIEQVLNKRNKTRIK